MLDSLGNNWLAVLQSSANRVLTTRIPATYLIVGSLVIWFFPNTNEFMSKYRPGITTYIVPSSTPGRLKIYWRPNIFWGLMTGLLILYILPKMNIPAPFIYGDF